MYICKTLFKFVVQLCTQTNFCIEGVYCIYWIKSSFRTNSKGSWIWKNVVQLKPNLGLKLTKSSSSPNLKKFQINCIVSKSVGKMLFKRKSSKTLVQKCFWPFENVFITKWHKTKIQKNNILHQVVCWVWKMKILEN